MTKRLTYLKDIFDLHYVIYLSMGQSNKVDLFF